MSELFGPVHFAKLVLDKVMQHPRFYSIHLFLLNLHYFNIQFLRLCSLFYSLFSSVCSRFLEISSFLGVFFTLSLCSFFKPLLQNRQSFLILCHFCFSEWMSWTFLKIEIFFKNIKESFLYVLDDLFNVTEKPVLIFDYSRITGFNLLIISEKPVLIFWLF